MFRTQKPWVRVYEGHALPEIEVQKGSLTDLFRAAVEEHRGKTALTFSGAPLDFARLEALSERMAASLAASGVKKGDRVALMLPNCPHYVISFFAVVRLGAIVTQVNPTYVEREVLHILGDSGAETIIAHSDGYPRIKHTARKTALKNVVVVDFAGEPEGLEDGHAGFDEFVLRDVSPAPLVEIDPAQDVAVLQYTGGTTGVSKGAMLTHRNLVANVQQALDLFVSDPADFSDNQAIMGILPMFHIFGLTCVMLFGLRQGLNQVLVPRFDPVEV
ncbi:MAG: AMP-binding protein, partial [Actinomycetota bacterium]|nr:AMP-binding protein [Actinomycetota bacterium]